MNLLLRAVVRDFNTPIMGSLSWKFVLRGCFKNFMTDKWPFSEPFQQFFANYMNIFYKTEVQIVNFRCWMGLQGAAVISRILLTSRFWKKHCYYTNKIVHQQKGLDLSFNLTPWKCLYLILYSREVIEVKKSKTRRAAIQFNKICFWRRECVAPSW